MCSSLAKQSSSSGEEYRYEYDSLGRLIRSSEYNNNEFVQRTEQIYDENDRLTQQSWYNGSGATSQTYKYSETNGLLTDLGIYYPGNTYDGKPNGVNNPSVGISYSYDALNRLSSKTTSVNGKGLFYNALWYAAINGYHRSSQVQQFNYRRSGTDDLILGFEYGYDTRGNIASEKNSISGAQQKYLYDGQNQLTEVKNGSGTTLYSYTYDTAGNLLSKTDGSTTHTYDYGNTAWADLLTSYDGKTISYDEIGNPTSYYNGSRYSFTWQQGRQLATAVKGSTSVSYAYDMAGVRSSKTVGSTTYNYITLSGKVMRQTWNGNVIDFIYDENNKPYEMRYKASGSSSYDTYYYLLNLQGDVVGLMNQVGNQVIEYKYDPWGKLLSTYTYGEAPAENEWYRAVAEINPLRYRGYYYDTETGFYYLQSRYYDPAIGRFINADTYTTTDASGILSTNMFAYCENNPVNRADINGNWSGWATAGLVVGSILCVAAVTVLTCGVGTATLAGAVAVGAAKGALVGAAVGTAAGAGIGYAATGTLEGAKTGAAIGFGAGAVVGAAVGGSVGANSWYSARALEFTNVGSNEVVLGRSGTYESMAQVRGSTYFHTSDARWNEVSNMFGVGKKGMWKINQAFLNQRISAGSTFVLSNNPITDGGYYFAKEVAYLVARGIGYTII